MSDFWKIEATSQNQTRDTSNVNNIIQAARQLLAEKYSHIVNNDIVADVSYGGCDDHVLFRKISFSSLDTKESIVINAHRICLNAADGMKYILFEYKQGIEDIFYCEQDDITKISIGPTADVERKQQSEEALYDNLICAIGTMLPTAAVASMSAEQVNKSAQDIAQYLLNKNYVQEACA